MATPHSSRYSFDGSLLHTLLCYALIAVGMLQFTGMLVGSESIRRLGLISGISPLPEVFGSSHGYEPMSHQSYFDFKLSDGSTAERTFMRHYSWRVQLSPAHVNRFSPYIYGINWAPVTPARARDRFLRKAFCDGGELARLVDLPPDILGFKVTIKNRNDGSVRFEYEVSCKK